MRRELRAGLATVLLNTALLTACGAGSGGDSSTGSGSGSGGGGSPHSYTVGGTVTGLSGSGLVLQDNGGDDLPLSTAADFTFATSVASGASYAVTVKSQPSGPSQTCVLSNQSGTVGSANVTNVVLSCSTNTFTVGGAVSGLSGSGLVLQDNGGDDLAVSSNGSFVFATAVASGAVYNVTIRAAPTEPTQGCALANSSGTVATGNIKSVLLSCGPLELLAGALGGSGNIDGTGAAARFASPYGPAVDAAGNLYVADSNNHTIRKITRAGIVTTLAGTAGISGSSDSDAAGKGALFNFPSGVATDAAGNVYVADTNNCLIRKITPAGRVTTLAGSPGACGPDDGSSGPAKFNFPRGLAVDAQGNVYVADTSNNEIRKITPGGIVTTLAGLSGAFGSTDSKDGTPTFHYPSGIAVDAQANLYVADEGNHTIRKITPAGTVSTLAGVAGNPGSADDTGNTTGAGRFNSPYDVAVDSAGNVYVADSGNREIRTVSPLGAVHTLAGSVSGGIGQVADGVGTAALFGSTNGVAVDSSGNVYVPDANTLTIRKIDAAANVTTFAGSAARTGTADGQGGAARFSYPQGVVADTVGNLFVVDTNNSTIRKVTPAGVVSTFAGKPGATGSADDTAGSVGAARFYWPSGITIDSAGNLYVADRYNDTIRKISPAGSVSTLAGIAGTAGAQNGARTVATFASPTDVVVDPAGNVYVADRGNNAIRKVDSAGNVTTLAGSDDPTKLGWKDGTGTAALFTAPQGVATDSAGNVYATDGSNTIRKITPGGVVTTVAGSGAASGSADGTAGLGGTARFLNPYSIRVDPVGNIYVADRGNHAIRKIDTAGNVTTVVGQAASQGVALGALPGSLNVPTGLTLLSGTGSGTTLVETDAEDAVLEVALP